MPKNNMIGNLKRSIRRQANLILSVLKKLSPRIYLYLRSLRFGKVEQITNDVGSIKGFEIPVKYDPKDFGYYKMYYYEGTKR